MTSEACMVEYREIFIENDVSGNITSQWGLIYDDTQITIQDCMSQTKLAMDLDVYCSYREHNTVDGPVAIYRRGTIQSDGSTLAVSLTEHKVPEDRSPEAHVDLLTYGGVARISIPYKLGLQIMKIVAGVK